MKPISSGYHGAWWLHPAAIVFLILIPIYLIIWAAGVHSGGEISTAKGFFYLEGNFALLGLLGLFVLGVGALSPVSAIKSRNVEHLVNKDVLAFVGILALLGYLVWFKDLILNPRLLVSAIFESSSFSYSLRSGVSKQAGIASLAQLGLPYIAVFSYTVISGSHSKLGRIHYVLMFLILASLAFRGFAWAERVALIEASMAFLLVWLALRRQSYTSKIEFVIRFAPLIGVPLVVLLFALGEYFRSWSAHYSSTEDSFWMFILQRLTNYYFNALNTGAGRLVTLDWPTYEFEWTLRWVHKLPLLGPMFSYAVGFSGDDFLYRYGDPEFNNPSGLFSLFYDLGVVGGLIVLLLVGAVGKYFYSYWVYGRSLMGVFYFLFLMSFFEIFRYFYLGDSRFFMVFVGFLVLLVSSKKCVTGEH